MTDKATMQEQVYDPMKTLKERFYGAKTQSEWDSAKEELKTLLSTASGLMDEKFFEKYKKGVVDSISKMYQYKEKQFNRKQFQSQPKLMFSKETDDVIRALADTMRQYYANLIDIQYMQYWEKKDE